MAPSEPGRRTERAVALVLFLALVCSMSLVSCIVDENIEGVFVSFSGGSGIGGVTYLADKLRFRMGLNKGRKGFNGLNKMSKLVLKF